MDVELLTLALASGVRGNAFQSWPQPPDQAAGKHQADCDQLRTGHDSAEHRPAPGIIAEEFEKVAGNAVKKEVCAEDLAIKFLPFQHPHQNKEIRQFDGRLEQLGWFESSSQRCSDPGLRQGILERHAPKMGSWFAVAATRRKTSDAANSMAQSQPRSECVAGGQGGHIVFMDVPGCGDERGNESAGKYSAGLQGREAENLARVGRVVAPIVDDVKNLCADDSRKHDQYSEIPGVFGIDSLLFRVADADPEPN